MPTEVSIASDEAAVIGTVRSISHGIPNIQQSPSMIFWRACSFCAIPIAQQVAFRYLLSTPSVRFHDRSDISLLIVRRRLR
jgi:hypothetical protein